MSAQEHPSKEHQHPATTTLRFREIPPDLQKVLNEHQEYIKTGGKKGQKADLRKADLRNLDLTAVNLCGANLQGAIFQGAHLKQADFRETNLLFTNFSGATGLDKIQLRLTKTWILAFYDDETLAQLELPVHHNTAIVEKNFIKVELKGANLREADLQGADLTGANLQNADLTNANLQGANLLETNLRDANLNNADLTGAQNLLLKNLARADLTDAQLPKEVAKFPELDHVAEASKNAMTQFFSILAVCAYAWLTLATTTDGALLTDTATSKLPIIGTSIQIVFFYVVAPLLLVALYLYFHLTLQGLYEGLASLPAVFPDGHRLDQQAYPWLLNRLVYRDFPRLQGHGVAFARSQVYLSLFLAWGLIPLTLIIIWLKYLVRQDWWVTLLHVMLLSLFCVGFGLRSYLLVRATLQGKTPEAFWRRFLSPIAVILSPIILLTVSFGAIYGAPSDSRKIFDIYRQTSKGYVIPQNYLRFYGPEVYDLKGILPEFLVFSTEDSLATYDVLLRTQIPKALSFLGFSSFANLEEVDFFTNKPPNWIGSEEQIEQIKGANLKARNLRCAQIRHAFLVKADLRQANLMWVDLRFAKLQKANLEESNLQGSELQEADLQGATIQKANLKRANLKRACLQKANLQEAKLQWAQLQGANLKDADLRGANLDGANLLDANLQGVQIQGVHLARTNLQGANLQGFKLIGADLQRANLDRADLLAADLEKANLENANLMGAILQEANLQGANLQGAKLKDADLKGAKFNNAILLQADFRETKGLIKEKLLTTKTWILALYDEGKIHELALPPDHNQKVNQKNFSNADLRMANLQGANLQGANLQGAKLQGANLQGADLRGVNNLDQEQLGLASIDEETKLPEDLKQGAKLKAKADRPGRVSQPE